jgi:hypothetical protein
MMYQCVGFIHMVYPQATILHMVRDPLDTLYSCLRNKFDHGGLEWTLQTEALVDNYITYLETVQHFREVLPGRFIDIRYNLILF